MKYDPYYRVNGINNDNRALIEQYLTKEQQQYLIDNSIAVDKFIKYIKIPEFNLQNYEYYNMLDRAKLFGSPEDLIINTNAIVSRLEVSFGGRSLQRCQTLITNNLVMAYSNQQPFDFENIDYYQIVRVLYGNDDYSYVENTNTYIMKLHKEGFLTKDTKEETLRVLTDSYDKSSLHMLLTTPLQDGTNIVFDPTGLDVVVDQNYFIGSYEPKQKSIGPVIDIPRPDWTAFLLDNDAHTHLKELFDDLRKNCDDGRGAYINRGFVEYNILLNKENRGILENPGFNEYQLGTTVVFQHKNKDEEHFNESATYQWLLENAHLYGYIIRYPEGKQEITGKEFRSNIFRYVGVELATLLHQSSWTLEEYNNQKQQDSNKDDTEI